MICPANPPWQTNAMHALVGPNELPPNGLAMRRSTHLSYEALVRACGDGAGMAGQTDRRSFKTINPSGVE
jgi:hypothetical protein